jgi:hypothetical protein
MRPTAAAAEISIPPSTCKDNNTAVERLTNYTCKEVNRVISQACHDTSSPWYDLAQMYVGVRPRHVTLPPTQTVKTQFDP